jgi:hypothetical protein
LQAAGKNFYCRCIYTIETQFYTRAAAAKVTRSFETSMYRRYVLKKIGFYDCRGKR